MFMSFLIDINIIYIHVYAFVYVYVYIYIYIHTHIIYIYIYIHTHTYTYIYINQSMIMGHFPHSKTHQELEQLQQMRAEERGGQTGMSKKWGGITADTSTYDYFN